MRAVILAGGYGTRLRPYTTIIPKPLVPVGERPILQHIIHQLCAAGIHDIDLCVNYLGALIQSYFSGEIGLPDDVNLRWHWEDTPLGTAGALQIVPDLDETFLAMNGDIFTSLDYRDLVDFHSQSGALLTVGMRQKPVHIDLGVITTSEGRVVDYLEKPSLQFDVSMGVYVFEPRALSYLPGGECQFPELVHLLLAAGEKVAAFRSDAIWYDIGTPEEHERASADLRLLADAADSGVRAPERRDASVIDLRGSSRERRHADAAPQRARASAAMPASAPSP